MLHKSYNTLIRAKGGVALTKNSVKTNQCRDRLPCLSANYQFSTCFMGGHGNPPILFVHFYLNTTVYFVIIDIFGAYLNLFKVYLRLML